MAQVLTISSVSTQYVLVPVTFTVGGTHVDPTADVVQMAFVAPGTTPQESDWKSATWEVTIGQFGAANTYAAKCLVGPIGTVALAAGGWATYVRITDNPEKPAIKAGEIRVI